jgi:hypothetical protein
MTKLISALSDPFWWVTAVIVAIVINVVSAFLFRRIDRKIAGLSEAWRIKAERRQKLRGQRVSLLRQDDKFLYLTLFEELRYRSRGTNFFLSAVALFVIAVIIAWPTFIRISFVLLGAVSYAIGQLAVNQAARLLFEVIDSSDSPPTELRPQTDSTLSTAEPSVPPGEVR